MTPHQWWLGLTVASLVAVTAQAGDAPLPAPVSGSSTPTKPTVISTGVVPLAGARLPAPSGAWFVAEYASARWEHGVAGFVPGQAVRVISTSKVTGKWIVTDGQFQVEVAPRQLTNDLAVAAALRQREEGDQHAVQAAREVDRLAREKARRLYAAALKRVELNHDIEEAEIVARFKPMDRGIGWRPGIYDRPYEMAGNPYTHKHGPHGRPVGLGFAENPRADDVDAVQRPPGR